MLVIALLATMTGRSSCHAFFSLFAKCKLNFLRQFMTLRNGPPCHDAFPDLFNALDPKPLAIAMTRFAQMLLEGLGNDPTAIDGKTLRGAFKNAAKRSPLHPVQAFAPEAGIDGKSNETAAMPALLEILNLAGCTVTVDALHTQRDIPERIMKKKGNNVLAVKGNRKSLHEDVQLRFPDPEARKKMASCQDAGEGHGRIGVRSARVLDRIGWPQERRNWLGLEAIGRVKAVRELKGRNALPPSAASP